MLRAPQVTVRAGSAALASCSSSSSARPALPPRSSGGVQRRRSASSPLIARAGNATEEASKAAEIGVDDCADNIGDFCTIDKAVGGWRERQREKERRRRERERRRRLSRASRRGEKGHHFCVLSGSPRRFFLFESEERVVVLAYERTEDDFVERARCQRGSKGSIGDSGRSDDGARSSSFFLSCYLTLSSSSLSRSNPTTTTTNCFRARSSPPSARWETRSRTLSRR